MSKIPILLLGATGYIGGSVLSRLLTHPNASTLEITVLVRSPEKAVKLEQFGVKTVIGSFTDHPFIESLSEQAHVLFSLADSNDLHVMQAILRGLKNRHTKTGDVPILIHTSGTGVLTFGDADAKGMAVTDTIYDDSNVEQMASLPPNAVHRPVDLAIVEADTEGYVKTHIIFPGIVHGTAQTALVDAGIQKSRSLGIALLSGAALDRGRAGMVGKGLPIWPCSEIADTADLHIVVFDAATANPDKTGHGVDGYYFAANGEVSWYDVSKAIGKAMVEFGVADTDEPTPFTEEEMIKYFGSVYMASLFGSNSRARATHSRSIGWKPKSDAQGLLAGVKPQFEVVLREHQK